LNGLQLQSLFSVSNYIVRRRYDIFTALSRNIPLFWWRATGRGCWHRVRFNQKFIPETEVEIGEHTHFGENIERAEKFRTLKTTSCKSAGREAH
jgi:hypothetical protein